MSNANLKNKQQTIFFDLYQIFFQLIQTLIIYVYFEVTVARLSC